MTTDIRVIEETELEKKKLKIISEITLRQADRIQIENNANDITTKSLDETKR